MTSLSALPCVPSCCDFVTSRIAHGDGPAVIVAIALRSHVPMFVVDPAFSGLVLGGLEGVALPGIRLQIQRCIIFW